MENREILFAAAFTDVRTVEGLALVGQYSWETTRYGTAMQGPKNFKCR